jgi:hypothetical protein
MKNKKTLRVSLNKFNQKNFNSKNLKFNYSIDFKIQFYSKPSKTDY